MANVIKKTEFFNPVVTQWENNPDITFDHLVSAVKNIHTCSYQTAVKAVNRYATMRNWLIGLFIVEYQQKGSDRAAYGEKLLKKLEESLQTRGLNVTLFQNCRLFYNLYPQVADLFQIQNQPTALAKSGSDYKKQPTSLAKSATDGDTLVSKLSFAHITELVHINDDTVRLFYETESIRCGWSVRELHRFIVTNLHVRVGVIQGTKSPRTTLPSVSSGALDIRQPYTFEFLGLKATEVITEGELEDALLDHLQDFLLELGKGFCFEARQKRLIIDDEYYYADLVFYHRILHCNVIVELKNDEFHHEHLGQLNAYVSYYKENEMHDGDNPPVGILLCTKAGKKMVEYATAGMDNKLFVSTYLLQLPDKSILERFIKENN